MSEIHSVTEEEHVDCVKSANFSELDLNSDPLKTKKKVQFSWPLEYWREFDKETGEVYELKDETKQETTDSSPDPSDNIETKNKNVPDLKSDQIPGCKNSAKTQSINDVFQVLQKRNYKKTNTFKQTRDKRNNPECKNSVNKRNLTTFPSTSLHTKQLKPSSLFCKVSSCSKLAHKGEFTLYLRKLKVKDIKSDRVSQFNFVSEDHYSFYERTSVRREARKGLGCKGSESTMENEGLQTISSETKGQQKSALPPLKDLARSQQRKQMTRNAFGQSKLDTKLQDDGNRGKENIVSTSSEKSKTLASVSFVGIYDLDDMNNTPKNWSDGVLNLEREQKVQGESNKEKPSEQVENTLGYVIQNLTLEGKSYKSKKNSLQNKLILPGIKENKKFIDDKFKTFKRRDTLLRLQHETMAKINKYNVLFEDIQIQLQRPTVLNVTEIKTRHKRPPLLLPKLKAKETSSKTEKGLQVDLELNVRGVGRKDNKSFGNRTKRKAEKRKTKSKDKIKGLSGLRNKDKSPNNPHYSLPPIDSKSSTQQHMENSLSFSNVGTLKPYREFETAFNTLVKVIERSKEEQKRTKERFQSNIVQGEQKPINEKLQSPEEGKDNCSPESQNCSVIS
ncbi:hypothetical protein AWC38_SpisGene1649 [Stylophora pistillata]|uniref:Uncharacterized protein n=1 Tax=Stylophora pistillata TaxID=50429 RepID=A0A2B4SWB8_STYPI|nr:hypothetical protein AWC38_SpisGene1649 [Stylophora pistillata]